MARMPFVGLIGTCGLGMLLSGCASPDRTNPRFAGGKADRGMGLLGQHQKSQGTTVPAPLGDVAGTTISPPSSTGSGGTFIPRGSSLNSSAGTGMSLPNNTNAMTTMSGSSTLPANSSPMSPLSANTTNPSAASNPMNTGNTVSPGLSSMGGMSLSSSAIRQVDHRSMDDSSSVKTASFSSADSDVAPNVSMKSMSSVIPPPPPTSDSYAPPSSSKTSSTAAKNTANSNISPYPPTGSSTPAPTPPPSPPPSMSMGTTSSMSSPVVPVTPSNPGNAWMPSSLNGGSK